LDKKLFNAFSSSNRALKLWDEEVSHLMSKGNELEFQGRAATKPESEHGNDDGKNRDHARDGTAVARKSLVTLGVSEF
jgi:hypothetical protein